MNTRLGGSYSTTTDSGAYTDLNRLSQLKGKDRDSQENVKKVAQEFESLFLNQMLKSMRSATESLADEDSPFSSQTTRQYQDMHDQQMAIDLSRGNGIGLADVLQRQLSKTDSTVGRSNPFAQATGLVSGESGAPSSTLGRAGAASSLAPVDPTRDDSGLLDRRRLALPGKLNERTAARLAGTDDVVTDTRTIAEQIGSDWKRKADSNPFAAKDTVQAADQQKMSRTEAVAVTHSKPRFEGKDDFIATMLPMAESAAKRLGVEPRYLVAQAALETGWGKHMVRQADGSSSNNLFGIKSHGWGGASASANTKEYVDGKPVVEKAKFRAYDSYADAFNDYVNFLQSNGRYSDALKTGGDSEQFMRELQSAGYATDPQYARKVTQIARNMNVYKDVQTLALADSGTARL